MIGVERDVVIEAVEFDEEAGEVVVSCRLRRGVARRCGECGRRCAGYDRGEDGAGGGRWMPARCGCSSRLRRPG